MVITPGSPLASREWVIWAGGRGRESLIIETKGVRVVVSTDWFALG